MSDDHGHSAVMDNASGGRDEKAAIIGGHHLLSNPFKRLSVSALICVGGMALASMISQGMSLSSPIYHDNMMITTSSSISSLDSSISASPVMGSCRAEVMGYRNIICPIWNPSSPDPLSKDSKVDWRVRYIYNHQHPSDCENANYMIGHYSDGGGFGAMLRGHLAGPFHTAVQAKRVYMINPDQWSYLGCESQKWSCYFEPLTNCSYDTHVSPLVDAYGEATSEIPEERDQWANKSQRVYSVKGWAPSGVFPSLPFDDLWQMHGKDFLTGVFMYMLRPNAATIKRVEAVLAEAIPCDFDPARTIALPIRASDKCAKAFNLQDEMGGEAECLDFDTYMEMADLIRQNDPAVDTIILTSEDKRFVEARHNYTDKGWRFITNPVDVMQGTGRHVDKNNHTMDQVFFSFYTSWHLQMRAKYYILNCASNFHEVLWNLVQEGGCSFVSRPVVICLTEQVGKFKICTIWGDYDKCVEEKKSALASNGGIANHPALRRLLSEGSEPDI